MGLRRSKHDRLTIFFIDFPIQEITAQAEDQPDDQPTKCISTKTFPVRQKQIVAERDQFGQDNHFYDAA